MCWIVKKHGWNSISFTFLAKDGKNTLFKCISEDLSVEQGKIYLVEDEKKRKLSFADVGMVSASPVLPEFLTGYEFVNFFVKINEEDLNGKSIDDYFEMMRIEEADRHKLIKHYSYGMKNKLQLLCCLIRRPKIILLDEPLSSFDIIVSHEIEETLLRMKDYHIIIMATHIMQLEQDISDEIVLLKQGRSDDSQLYLLVLSLLFRWICVRIFSDSDIVDNGFCNS